MPTCVRLRFQPFPELSFEDVVETFREAQVSDVTELHNFAINIDSPTAFSRDQIDFDQPMDN